MAIKTLILTQVYVQENTIISDQIDFALLRPVILKIQDLKLKEILGSDLFNEIMLQTSTDPDTLTTANQTLCDDYILPMLAWYLVSQSLLSLKFRITQAGIMVNSTENSQPGDTTDLQILEKRYANDAKIYGDDMIKYLRANLTLYPLYKFNTGIDKTQPIKNAYDCGLYLDPNIDRCNCIGVCYCGYRHY